MSHPANDLYLEENYEELEQAVEKLLVLENPRKVERAVSSIIDNVTDRQPSYNWTDEQVEMELDATR